MDSQESCLPDRILWVLATAHSADKQHLLPYAHKTPCQGHFLYLIQVESYLMSVNSIFLFLPNEPNHRKKLAFKHRIPYLETFACFDESRLLSTWTVLDSKFGSNTVINHNNLSILPNRFTFSLCQHTDFRLFLTDKLL